MDGLWEDQGISKSDGTLGQLRLQPVGQPGKQNDKREVTTWYIRDAQRNMMGLYDNQGGGTSWREQHLYGSSRLGIWNPNISLSNASGTSAWDTVGKKSYELVNHLGNVMSTYYNRTICLLVKALFIRTHL